MSEARIDRLEDEIKATLARLEPMIIHIDATLPHLATKAELTTGLADLKADLTTGLADLKVELANKPSRGYLWMVFSALIVAYAAGIGALAVVLQLHSSSAPAPHASIAPAVLAPPCKDASQTCKPWERDWSTTQLQPGSAVTDEGTVIPPTPTKPR
jgi:hypothetical protein